MLIQKNRKENAKSRAENCCCQSPFKSGTGGRIREQPILSVEKIISLLRENLCQSHVCQFAFEPETIRRQFPGVGRSSGRRFQQRRLRCLRWWQSGRRRIRLVQRDGSIPL